jgi:phosphoribosyl-ATP pyrophosphohydrolase/phosphoribosyl-AMP cyclohydrolase
VTGALPVPQPAYGPDGLVPAVVQDASDGRVLMVAWMDAEALEATVRTGDVHFHSRSRGRLWKKGETSGNILRLRSIAADCDADTLLVMVDPAGPTCHRGARSCFDSLPGADAPGERGPAPGPPAAGAQGFAWLETLWTTIAARAAERPSGSYTSALLDGGVDAVARKIAEEATEVVLAAKDDASAEAARADRQATGEALGGELADLLYHALVLVAERGQRPADVIDVLRARHSL